MDIRLNSPYILRHGLNSIPCGNVRRPQFSWLLFSGSTLPVPVCDSTVVPTLVTVVWWVSWWYRQVKVIPRQAILPIDAPMKSKFSERWHYFSTVCLKLAKPSFIPLALIAHDIFVRKPEEKRPLGRPRRRWENNIKIDHREIGCGDVWINLAKGRRQWRALVNTVMNLRVP
jgi:hypothetical protein